MMFSKYSAKNVTHYGLLLLIFSGNQTSVAAVCTSGAGVASVVVGFLPFGKISFVKSADTV